MIHPHDKIHQFYKLLCQDQRQFSLKSLVVPSHFQRHVADMECVAAHLRESVVAELGAGIGLNIFLLAILCPAKRFIAIEKNNKRRGWIQIQRKQLQLENIETEPQLSDLSNPKSLPTGLLVKAFSPRHPLPKLLERCPSCVVRVYVVEGVREGLSPLIPKTQFSEIQTVPMSHGEQRTLKIFQRLDIRE